jgi:hypothetical protein
MQRWLQCMERCGVEGPVCTGTIFSGNRQNIFGAGSGKWLIPMLPQYIAGVFFVPCAENHLKTPAFMVVLLHFYLIWLPPPCKFPIYSSLPPTNISPLPPCPLAFPPGVCMIHSRFTGEIPLLPIAKTMPMSALLSKTPPAAGWLSRCISSRCLCLPYSCQHHIRQLALPSASASCRVLFSSTPASCCAVSRQPATLRPPPIASHANGWLLHLPPAPSSLITCSWPLLALCRCLPFHLSRASSPAGCRVASTNAAASDLPASPPLIPPSPLVAPLLQN